MGFVLLVNPYCDDLDRWARLRKRPDPGPVDIARFMPITLVVVVVMIGMSALLIYADIVKPVIIF
jgi:hypothetical protein